MPDLNGFTPEATCTLHSTLLSFYNPGRRKKRSEHVEHAEQVEQVEQLETEHLQELVDQEKIPQI